MGIRPRCPPIPPTVSRLRARARRDARGVRHRAPPSTASTPVRRSTCGSRSITGSRVAGDADGLSLPRWLPRGLHHRYMKPGVVQEDGSHWPRAGQRPRPVPLLPVRFDLRPRRALPLDQPDEKFLHRVSLTCCCPARTICRPYLRRCTTLALLQGRAVRARTVFMCRQNDPLLRLYLDALRAICRPAAASSGCRDDRDSWAERSSPCCAAAAAPRAPLAGNAPVDPLAPLRSRRPAVT